MTLTLLLVTAGSQQLEHWGHLDRPCVWTSGGLGRQRWEPTLYDGCLWWPVASQELPGCLPLDPVVAMATDPGLLLKISRCPTLPWPLPPLLGLPSPGLAFWGLCQALPPLRWGVGPAAQHPAPRPSLPGPALTLPHLPAPPVSFLRLHLPHLVLLLSALLLPPAPLRPRLMPNYSLGSHLGAFPAAQVLLSS